MKSEESKVYESEKLQTSVEKFGGEKTSLSSLIEYVNQEHELQKAIESIDGSDPESEKKIENFERTRESIRNNAREEVSRRIGGEPARSGEDIIKISGIISEIKSQINEAEKKGLEADVARLEIELKDYEKSLFEKNLEKNDSESERETDDSVPIPPEFKKNKQSPISIGLGMGGSKEKIEPEFVEPAKKSSERKKTGTEETGSGKKNIVREEGGDREVDDKYRIPSVEDRNDYKKETIKSEDISGAGEKESNSEFKRRSTPEVFKEKGKENKDRNIDNEKRARERIFSEQKGKIREAGMEEKISFWRWSNLKRLPAKPFKWVKSQILSPIGRSTRSLYRDRSSKEINWIENRQRQLTRPGQRLEILLNSLLISSKDSKLVKLQSKYDSLEEEIGDLDNLLNTVDNEEKSLESESGLRPSDKRYFDNQRAKIEKKKQKIEKQKSFLGIEIEKLTNAQKLRKEWTDINIKEVISVLDKHISPLSERQEKIASQTKELENNLQELQTLLNTKEEELEKIHRDIKANPRLKDIHKIRSQRLKSEIEKAKEIISSIEFKIINFKEKLLYLNERVSKWEAMEGYLKKLNPVKDTVEKKEKEEKPDDSSSEDTTSPIPATKVPKGTFDGGNPRKK